MAKTSFSNVKAVVVAGSSLTEATSLSVEFSASPSFMATNGYVMSDVITVGNKTGSVTATGLDPVTFLAVVTGSGATTFSMVEGCDADAGGGGGAAGDERDYTLGTSVGESFEFDSGGPGEIATCTATAQLILGTYTPADGTP